MKQVSFAVLRAVVMLSGVVVLVGMLWEPHLEGVNATKSFWAVYADPFVAVAYLGAVPFFVGVYQASQFLGYAARDEASAIGAVSALRQVKYCALAAVAFIVAAEVWIVLVHGDDDAAGVFALGILATIVGLATAVGATALERSLGGGSGLKPAANR